MFNRPGQGRGGGFTLTEVLVVVTIIGIAGALVVPNVMQAGTLGVQAAGRMVIADILIAQNDAIAAQEVRRVIFDTANNRYRVTDGSNNTLTVTWRTATPGGGNYVVDFQNDDRFEGVSLDNVDFGGAEPLVLEFNALGTPTGNGGDLQLVSGDQRFVVSVSPFTGRVSIAPFVAEVEEPEGEPEGV